MGAHRLTKKNLGVFQGQVLKTWSTPQKIETTYVGFSHRRSISLRYSIHYCPNGLYRCFLGAFTKV
jgi:hypothetical protein